MLSSEPFDYACLSCNEGINIKEVEGVNKCPLLIATEKS